jgi:hypothetical protein
VKHLRDGEQAVRTWRHVIKGELAWWTGRKKTHPGRCGENVNWPEPALVLVVHVPKVSFRHREVVECQILCFDEDRIPRTYTVSDEYLWPLKK